MHSTDILRDLIAFPTISHTSNLALIDHVADLLEGCGAIVEKIPASSGQGMNLWATIGPSDQPGVVLSGHSDVVPVEGQAWSSDPFVLTARDGRLFGRGTADMKGFLACAIAAMLRAGTRPAALRAPLQLAISCDEEIGCVGVRSMLARLAELPVRPLCCIVGEPTSMAIATGHKGKIAALASCRGKAAHSALAPSGLNAIHLAADLVSALRAEQAMAQATASASDDFAVPYATIHAGTIHGGTALNIVPEYCDIAFEIRTVDATEADAILDRIRVAADRIVAPHRAATPEAVIAIDVTNAYPGLRTSDDAAIAFVSALTGTNRQTRVDFGTEGGLYQSSLGVPVVVCGPGSMDQGHKADEYVDRDQLARCDAMMAALVERLTRAPVFQA